MSEEFFIALDGFGFQRENMIRDQIKRRGVKDSSVLRAMSKIPREKFLPEQSKHLAYRDGSAPIGASQTISQPYVVALMIENLALTKESKVLEVGTGSGYNTAVLSYVAKEVYSVEIIPTLHFDALDRFKRLNYKNIFLKLADGHRGWADHAPYDSIIVTAALEEVPNALLNQLKRNGILVAPVGTREIQTLIRYRKTLDGTIEARELAPVRFVNMISLDPR